MEERVALDGERLTDARAGSDQRIREPIVTFRFDSLGASLFEENIGRPFATVLDGKVLTAPVIRDASVGCSRQISGNSTVDETVLLSALQGSNARPFWTFGQTLPRLGSGRSCWAALRSAWRPHVRRGEADGSLASGSASDSGGSAAASSPACCRSHSVAPGIIATSSPPSAGHIRIARSLPPVISVPSGPKAME